MNSDFMAISGLYLKMSRKDKTFLTREESEILIANIVSSKLSDLNCVQMNKKRYCSEAYTNDNIKGKPRRTPDHYKYSSLPVIVVTQLYSFGGLAFRLLNRINHIQ